MHRFIFLMLFMSVAAAVTVIAGDEPEPKCLETTAPMPAKLHEAVVRAEAMADKGQYARAAASLTEFLNAHPDLFHVYVSYDIGHFYHRAGRMKNAVVHLKTAVDKAPCFHEAWQLLAMSFYKDGQVKAAADAMEKAVRLTGDHDLTYQAAVFHLEAGRPRKALPLLQTLENVKPARTEWLIALSNALAALKEKVATAETMEKAARTGRDPDIMFHAAWLWLEADRPQNALKLLEMLAERKTVKVDWLLVLCNTYMTLDRNLEAANTMERAIGLEPTASNLYTGGLLWLQADRHQKALPHLIRLSKMPAPEADWFVALCQAWLKARKIPEAAAAMERAFELSAKPDHAYQAGLMRLQLEEPDRALKMLEPLGRYQEPLASWLVALSNAWTMKEMYPNAAPVMERAAWITRNNKDFFRAAQLWLQAESPGKALPLLDRLAAMPKPEAKWLLTLANTHQMLDQIPQAASAMERAAGITKTGKHYYRAAMLWQQADKRDKTIELLRLAVYTSPVEQRWYIDLASFLMETDNTREALQMMEKTRLGDTGLPAKLRYRGAALWRALDRPEKAMPILEVLCDGPDPEFNWLASYLKSAVEQALPDQAQSILLQLLEAYPERVEAWRLAVWVAREQSDFAKAAAAMDVVMRLKGRTPANIRELSTYLHMAGAPLKAAQALEKALGSEPSVEELERIRDIYLSGKWYDHALRAAEKALSIAETAQRWETVGDIAYLLRRFDQSADAYERAAALRPDPTTRMKAGYACMKMGRYTQAADHMARVLNRQDAPPGVLSQASQCLAYINSILEFMPDQRQTGPFSDNHLPAGDDA